MKKLFLSLILLAFIASVTVTGISSAAPEIDPAKYYKLVNRNSGKLLDVSNKSSADGGNVIQWTDTGGTNQQWQFVSTGNGYYKIVNRNSGKLLDVSGKSTADGADVIQWTDNGGANQQWSFVDAGDGYYKLVNRNSGKLLDVSSRSMADGEDIQPLVCDNGTGMVKVRCSFYLHVH